MMMDTITGDYFCVFANLRELFVKFQQLAKYFQIPGAGSEAVWLVVAGLWPRPLPPHLTTPAGEPGSAGPTSQTNQNHLTVSPSTNSSPLLLLENIFLIIFRD